MTLEELARRSYEFQCSMINGTEPNDTSFPHFIGENDKGEVFIYATPFNGDDGDGGKDVILAALKQHFRENNIIRYATASEAWVTTRSATDPEPDLRPSEDPQREDVVLVVAVDKQGNQVLHRARIVMADDNKRHVDPMENSEGFALRGRMLDLLK